MEGYKRTRGFPGIVDTVWGCFDDIATVSEQSGAYHRTEEAQIGRDQLISVKSMYQWGSANIRVSIVNETFSDEFSILPEPHFYMRVGMDLKLLLGCQNTQ